MILKVFRENQTFVALLSVLASIFLWILSGFVKPFEPDYLTLYNSTFFFLFPGIKSLNEFRLICSAINVLLVVINSIYLSRIIFKFQLVQRRNSLTQFLFIVLSFPFFITYNGISYSLISLIFLQRAIFILFNSYEKQSVSFGYFDAAMLISVASIFNFYAIFLIVFLFYVLILFKGLAWRETTFIVLGLLVPYLVYISVLYIFNQDISAFFKSYKQMVALQTVLEWNLLFWGLLAFIAFLALISSVKMANDFSKMKIASRKYSVAFFGLFIITSAMFILYPIVEKDMLFFSALPLAYLFGNYFFSCRVNLINQVLFIALLSGNLIYVYLA